MQAAQTWYARSRENPAIASASGTSAGGTPSSSSSRRSARPADIRLALNQDVESLRTLGGFVGAIITCLWTKTAIPTTKKIVASTHGDGIVPLVNMVFKFFHSIDRATRKSGRAPKAALEREISSWLDKFPHAPVKGKGKGNSSTDS